MEIQETHLKAVREKNGRLKTYENHESNDFIAEEDVIGFDSNVLVDMVNSSEFQEDLKAMVTFGTLKIYATELALGEARHVLIKKKDYSPQEATNGLLKVMNDFSIEKVIHTDEGDRLGEDWVNFIKKRMRIKKFSTFPNDCKILSNLFYQKKINIYFTEDRELKRAVDILKLKIRVKIMTEASRISEKKVKDFFREMNKSFYKKRKPF